jgi:hypothetical protein
MSDVFAGRLAASVWRSESEESHTGAADAIRALIEAILLEPDGERLKITLKGDLAGMLSAARDTKRSPETGDLMLQIKLVAGPATVITDGDIGGRGISCPINSRGVSTRSD